MTVEFTDEEMDKITHDSNILAEELLATVRNFIHSKKINFINDSVIFTAIAKTTVSIYISFINMGMEANDVRHILTQFNDYVKEEVFDKHTKTDLH